MNFSLRIAFISIATLLTAGAHDLAAKSSTPSPVLPTAKSTLDKVSTRYLQSFADEEIQEQAAVENYQNYIKQKGAKVHVSEIQEFFGPTAQLKVAYAIQNNTPYGDETADLVAIPETTLTDLRLFCGDQDTPKNHVFARIDHTKTVAGRVALQKILAQPTHSIKVLKARQAFAKLMLSDESLYGSITSRLNKIQEAEIEFLSIMRAMQEEVEKYYQEVLFESSWLKPLNKNATFMQSGTYMLAGREFFQKVFVDFATATLCSISAGQPVYSIYYGISYGYYAFVPTMETEMRVLSGILGIFNTYLLGDGLYKMHNRLPIVKKLKDKMSDVAQVLVTTHRDLVQTLVAHDQALEILPDLTGNDLQSISEFKPTLNVLKNLHDSSFKAGNACAAFTRREEIKESFADSYKLLGLIDAYTSIATLMKAHAHNQNGHYCFVDYLAEKKPSIDFKGFWHPMLDPKKVVINDVKLGTDKIPNNAFITGPNAGGKTTAIRSMGLAILFAQTIGVAAARQARMTPFSNIATYLNVADSEGKESLFQAEMRRAHALLDTVKTMDKDKFSFVIVDEIFTGTNPKEGTAAAYGVAKKLSSYDNSMAIITTHFIELTDMAKETKRFTNFKVSVREVNGKFEFPYKLEDGIANQNIALQLLSEDGFDEDVLKDAKDYLKRK